MKIALIGASQAAAWLLSRRHEATLFERFERPLVDSASQRAPAALQDVHAESDRRVWTCDSYAQAGIPLPESAARSAQEVALRLGAPLS